ncbi:MAG: aldehyde dehydrogenase family protein [Pseudomonadota bacterium]
MTEPSSPGAIEPRPLFLANCPLETVDTLAVTDKYSGEIFARVCIANASLIAQAVHAAVQAEAPMRRLPAWRRRDILRHCVNRFEQRRAELADALCREAGKPIRDARVEVMRLIETFAIAAEEATRSKGEVLPMDISVRGEGYSGMWKRVPVGACGFITPFNFPLNLVAHKVAPAIAAGCPFVLKPASLTPLGALIIGEILAETDLPPGAFSILPAERAAADALVTDDRLKLLSFTGSDSVGWDMKARAGKKRVTLELGGNAAVIIDETADVDFAVERCAFGAFYQSGQSCISVQRILVHESHYENFREKLVAKTKTLATGDPRDEGTFCGPIISEKEAQRIEAWIESARNAGARVLCGGERNGLMVTPCVAEDVPDNELLKEGEVFGPVCVLESFVLFDEAIERVNASRYGLQAGVFTRDRVRMMQAWNELEVGGVIVGDIPSWRMDHMPYGGVKDSGIGREGVSSAIADMTEVRLLVSRES